MEKMDASLASAGKPCDMGTDPAAYLEKFEDWFEQTDLMVNSVGVTDDKRKLNLILLWGGRDFRDFAKEAGVITAADDADHPDTVEAAVTKIRQECGKYTNYSMAMFDLMHAKQGTRTITEFNRDIKRLAVKLQLEVRRYTKEMAMRDAIIFGTSDDKLRQEALTKDLDHKALIRTAASFEQARKSSGTIKSANGEAVNQVTFSQSQVEEIVARVTAPGKYSSRGPPTTPKSQKLPKCQNCPPHYRPHAPDRCPARGKTCAVCKKLNHFAKSQACSKEEKTVCQVDETYVYPCSHLEVIGVGRLRPTTGSNWVSLQINGQEHKLLVDYGCMKTLIPEQMAAKNDEIRVGLNFSQIVRKFEVNVVQNYRQK